VETDDAVGEQPDAVEQGIASEDPTDGRAGQPDGIHNLGKHHCTHGATEGAQQRRADILGHLLLELDALAFGFV